MAKMMERGYRLLRDGRPRAALTLGKKLEAQRYSGGFEIQARALADLKKRPEAISLLERTVETVTDVWLLWQLLGNYLSDDGRFQDAFSAYERALALEGADEFSVQYNYANALMRAGHALEAKEKVTAALRNGQTVQDQPELWLLIGGLYADILNREMLYTSAEEHIAPYLNPWNERRWPSHTATLYAQRARARHGLGRDDEALADAFCAIKLEKLNAEAQWAIREIRKSEDYSKAKYYRLLLKGEWPDSNDSYRGFYVSYDVVADTEAEALDFVREFEPELLSSSLRLDTTQIVETDPQPKGVYSVSKYHWFKDE